MASNYCKWQCLHADHDAFACTYVHVDAFVLDAHALQLHIINHASICDCMTSCSAACDQTCRLQLIKHVNVHIHIKYLITDTCTIVLIHSLLNFTLYIWPWSPGPAIQILDSPPRAHASMLHSCHGSANDPLHINYTVYSYPLLINHHPNSVVTINVAIRTGN